MVETYQYLTVSQLNRPDLDNPIIPPLRGSANNILTPLAIHKVIKEALTIAGDTLSITNPEAAEKLWPPVPIGCGTATLPPHPAMSILTMMQGMKHLMISINNNIYKNLMCNIMLQKLFMAQYLF
jgi:hypothetical protein